MFLKNKAKFLAKNFAISTLKYGPMILRRNLDDLVRTENLNCHNNALNKINILSYAWKAVSRFNIQIGTLQEGYEIWNYSYNILIEDIKTDVNFGIKYAHLSKQEGEIKDAFCLQYKDSDERLIENFMQEKEISERPMVFFTDGSRSEASRATDASVMNGIKTTI